MANTLVPLFPEFKKIQLSHKDDIEKLIKEFPPYSDFNFTSMWTYNTDDSMEISLLNNNLVVKFVDYISLKPFFSFIGRNSVKETSKTLLEHAIACNMEPYLKLIPDLVICAESTMTEEFDVREDRDNFDYVISIDEIVELHPDKYKRKRNNLERFKRKYPGYEVKKLDLNNKEQVKELIDLFNHWEQINGKDRNETMNELTAICRLIEGQEYLNTYALGVYHGGKMIGFNIYEAVHNSYAMSAFQKGDKSYDGIYTVLSHEVAKHLATLGCHFINYEQDLGIEGLRLSKSIWKPAHFLKKYIISLKK